VTFRPVCARPTGPHPVDHRTLAPLGRNRPACPPIGPRGLSGWPSAAPAAFTSGGAALSMLTITPVSTPTSAVKRSGFSIFHPALVKASEIRLAMANDSGFFQYGMIWYVCGENHMTRPAIRDICSSESERAANRFCSEMICKFYCAIVDCCEELPSSNAKSNTLQSVSITTPQITSRLAISRTESGPPSQTIPAPTAIVPNTAPPSRYIWTKSATRSVTNVVNISVHILPILAAPHGLHEGSGIYCNCVMIRSQPAAVKDPAPA
jgi:hypothetical protein